MTDTALLGKSVVRSEKFASDDRSLEAQIKSRGAAAVPQQQNRDTLPTLTGLRGLAALMVLYYHGGLGPHQDLEFPVLLFFVLSGFLMGYLYYDKPADASNLIRYSLARIGRVFPAYLFLVVVFEAIPTLWCTGYRCYSAKDIAGMLAFWKIPFSVMMVGHSGAVMYWTVPVEVQFYVVFAAAWWLSKSQALGGYLKRAIFAAVSLAYAAAFVKLVYGAPETTRPKWLPFASLISALPLPTVLIDEKGICMGNDFCLPSYVPVFAVGSLLGANWKSKIAPVCNKVPPLVIEVTAALSLILCVAPLRSLRATYGLELKYPGTTTRAKSALTTYSMTFLDPASWIVAIGAVVTCAHGARSLAILRTDFFQFTGKVSYSMYLINMWIFELVYKQIDEENLVMKYTAASVAVAIVYAIASVSFLYFEAPTQAWVRSLHSSYTAVLALVVGYAMTVAALYFAIKLL